MATLAGTVGGSLEIHCTFILTVRSNCLHYQLGSVLPTGVPGVSSLGQEPGSSGERQLVYGFQLQCCGERRAVDVSGWVLSGVDCVCVLCILCGAWHG